MGLVDAWYRAKSIGLPLTEFTTFAIKRIAEMDRQARPDAWHGIRRQIHVRLRRLKIEPAYVWTREVKRDGTGEHLHLIAHVPPDARHEYQAMLSVWLPEPGEIDTQRSSYAVTRSRHGHRHSVLAYMAKQMEKDASDATGFERRAEGPLVGKRCGWTVNLRPNT